MSKVEAKKCDNCSKITFDYMLDNWIVIEGNFTKYGGRKKNGQAFTEIFLGGQRTTHFCSWDCLRKIKTN